VASELTKIYTGGAIRDRVASLLGVSHTATITGVNAVAGAGKTFSIIQGAGKNDVVLCETRKALEEAAQGLIAKPDWSNHHYTVDAFLVGARDVGHCDTLWVDEAYRLHAGKLHAVIKALRPTRVRCYGDDKQVSALPFVPGFDFVHHTLEFDRLETIRNTRRCPADVCFVMSQRQYYGFHVVTHNPILRSVEGPIQYVSGMFQGKRHATVILTYTQSAAKDLRAEGLSNVMTIGEAQGSNFDEVILFREKDLKKALYYSLEHTLVGMTRHKRRLTVVSTAAAGTGDSLAELACGYLKARSDELVLSSHLADGVAAVASPEEYYAKQLRQLQPTVASLDSSEWDRV